MNRYNSGMPGEFDFIRWLTDQAQASPLVRVGIGDDLAVLDWPRDVLVVGVDQVLDRVHFDLRHHTPRQVGRKVMNRNLSDCAAMACLPVAAVVTAALPRGAGLELAQELYHGLREAAGAFDCLIVGGDTASWDGPLVVTVTILGRGDGIAPITRHGARPGDGIYVTGPLGGSLRGRHMDFVPRVREARDLARTGRVHAMIDISDGLSRDLGHICRQSQVGATIDASAVPIHPDARAMAERDNRTPLEHALHDGEDHELLFTAAGNADLPAVRIGTITAEPGIWLVDSSGQRTPLDPKGWEHTL